MKTLNRALMLLVTLLLLLPAACSDKPNNATVSNTAPASASPATATAQPAASPATTAPPAVPDRTAPGVTFTARPNPIKVCDGSGLGITSLDWKTPGIKEVEIHVGTPDGPMMSRGHAEGKAETQKWVTNGLVFYLQDNTGIDKTPAQRTIGTVTVNLTTEGCP